MPITSAKDTKPTTDPLVGQMFAGKYLIERLIGRGGMGLVYLAELTAASTKVVIKLLAPHFLDDKDAVARFEREGKRLSELTHPNIVALYECGHGGSQAYISMEYLDGEPLRRFLQRKKKLTLQEFIPIASQILLAVGYAHSHRMMLRDIKPANIMLCEKDGKANFVKLLDFGLAKLVDRDDEAEITKAHVIGTAGYLAPELIRGEASDVRVDVYALGVLFYLMLAGESPIAGDNDGALLYNHVHGTPTPLASRLPAGHNVPEEVIALIHQCLEKDQNRRPEDANEIAEALFEAVPPSMFHLPVANEESRAAIRDYRESRLRDADADAGESSAEWTRPRPTQHAVSEVREAAGIGGKPGARPQPSPPARPQPPRPPAASSSSDTTEAPQRAKTMFGLPPAPMGAAATPASRRPGPPEKPRAAPAGRPPQPPTRAGPGAARSAPSAVPTMAHPTVSTAPARPAPRRPTPAATPAADRQPKHTLIGVPLPTSSTAAAPGAGGAATTQTRMPAPKPLPQAPSLEDTVSPASTFVGAEAIRDTSEGLAAPLAGARPIELESARRSKTPLFAAIGAAVAAAIVVGVLAMGGEETPPSSASTGASATSTVDAAKATPASTAMPPGGGAQASATPTQPVAEGGTPSADAKLGVLAVSAVDGARVEVDGQDVGTAPYRGEIPEGKHKIRVTAAGYSPWEGEIDIVAGGEQAVAPKMEAVVAATKKGAKPGKGGKSGGTLPTKPDPVGKSGSGDAPAPKPAPPPPPDPKKSADSGDDMSKKKDDGDVFLPVGGK